MRTAFIKQLKNCVEETFGRRILSSNECIQLAEAIFQKTEHALNANTLRRFFGLVKSEYLPSLNTLNVLSRYCGFNSYDAFVRYKEHEPELAGHESVNNRLLHYLVTIFQDLDVRDANDPTYTGLVSHTIHFLRQEPDLVRRFQREISKTKNGQDFYFEQFVNIDKLCSFYGEGLLYYLNEKNTPGAQIFGHSLLCQKSWLCMDDEAVDYHFGHVIRYTVDHSYHPFISARYFAASLYYKEMTGRDLTRSLMEARDFYRSLRPSREAHTLFPFFELIFSDVLVLLGQYEEALFYIEEAMKKRVHFMPPFLDRQLYQSFDLYYAISLAKTGRIAKAKEVWEKIDPDGFYFLSKQYHTILYLQFQNEFVQKSKSGQEQLRHLIGSTGFRRLGAPSKTLMNMR